MSEMKTKVIHLYASNFGQHHLYTKSLSKIIRNDFLTYPKYLMRLFQEVSGQIFEVDEKMLQFLDDFEEHPNVYQRVEVNVMVESGIFTEFHKYFL